MKREEFLQKKALADSMNFAPPAPDENYMVSGKRAQCIKPTLLNAAREKLGYNPRYSMFEQCRTVNPKRY